jgi:hypothetical protein
MALKRKIGAGFIIQIDRERNFFTRLIDGLPFGTAFPSFATHLEYAVADEICQRIRERGYAHAVVCDRFGTPVDVAALEKIKAIDTAVIRRFWGE